MKLCKVIVGLFGLLWLLALAIFLVGQFGLFGQERDPLAGVFLVPLGFPWNRFIEIAPEATWPWLAAAMPLINLALLRTICRVVGNKSTN